jgi:hypothetical protein
VAALPLTQREALPVRASLAYLFGDPTANPERPMRQYRYVIAASDGTSYDYARHEKFEEPIFDLPELLADGWRPVRETPMGSAAWKVEGEPVAYGLVLILLEKKFPEEKPTRKKADAKKTAGA